MRLAASSAPVAVKRKAVEPVYTVKIFPVHLYFKSYTVRVETLMEFCDFVERKFQMMLGYTQMRWLALLPPIERVLKLFLPLKSYFQSQDICPLFLQNFFETPLSEVWLYFVHSQASSFHEAVKKVEGQSI
jgi:hypothetical protein